MVTRGQDGQRHTNSARTHRFPLRAALRPPAPASPACRAPAPPRSSRSTTARAASSDRSMRIATKFTVAESTTKLAVAEQLEQHRAQQARGLGARKSTIGASRRRDSRSGVCNPHASGGAARRQQRVTPCSRIRFSRWNSSASAAADGVGVVDQQRRRRRRAPRDRRRRARRRSPLRACAARAQIDARWLLPDPLGPISICIGLGQLGHASIRCSACRFSGAGRKSSLA